MDNAMREAVRRGASEHAARFVEEHGAPVQSNLEHLLEALEFEPGGIPAKVRIALTSIVKHAVDLERRVDRLERVAKEGR